MKLTKCKALMHCGTYVDGVLLNKGIYLSLVPRIYPMTATIESMVENAGRVRQMLNLHDSYFENLKKCELVEVSILTDEQLTEVINIGRKKTVTAESVKGQKSYWTHETLDEIIKTFNDKK